jgi:hypothetical protein
VAEWAHLLGKAPAAADAAALIEFLAEGQARSKPVLKSGEVSRAVARAVGAFGLPLLAGALGEMLEASAAEIPGGLFRDEGWANRLLLLGLLLPVGLRDVAPLDALLRRDIEVLASELDGAALYEADPTAGLTLLAECDEDGELARRVVAGAAKWTCWEPAALRRRLVAMAESPATSSAAGTARARDLARKLIVVRDEADAKARL